MFNYASKNSHAILLCHEMRILYARQHSSHVPAQLFILFMLVCTQSPLCGFIDAP